MALEKYEYPATGAVTNSFLPSRNPSFADAEESQDEGILLEQSSGKQAYIYDEAVDIKIFRRTYARMPASERTSYEAFRDVVGGQQIKFTDYNGTAHTVTFADFVRAFSQSTGNRWTWTVTMRKEL